MMSVINSGKIHALSLDQFRPEYTRLHLSLPIRRRSLGTLNSIECNCNRIGRSPDSNRNTTDDFRPTLFPRWKLTWDTSRLVEIGRVVPVFCELIGEKEYRAW